MLCRKKDSKFDLFIHFRIIIFIFRNLPKVSSKMNSTHPSYPILSPNTFCEEKKINLGAYGGGVNKNFGKTKRFDSNGFPEKNQQKFVKLLFCTFLIKQSWWPKLAINEIICLCILDKLEANSASISKLATSKVTDLEMTPVKRDNSWRPAKLKRLL